MAENFSKKYAHLKPKSGEIPARRAGNYPNTPQLPEGHGREWVHPENGFVKLFCEEYGDEEKDASQDE